MTATTPVAELSKLRGMPLTYALIARARGKSNVIAMGRGDPDFDTPAHVIQAAQDAMVRASGEHPPVEGLSVLRRAIAERVLRYNGIRVDPEREIVVTNGGQEALCLMVMAAVGEGEGLIVPDPNYNTYLDALRFVRGVPITVPTDGMDGFRIDPERVRAAVDANPHAKALLLVSPGNPGGGVTAPDDVRALVRLAAERDLIILADDIYDRFLFDGATHLSPQSLPHGASRTLTLNAMSKAFAMTGWRSGWITGPAHLMLKVRAAKAALSGASSVVSQYAALAALTGPQDAVEHALAALTRRRKIVMDAFEEIGFRFAPPRGGQFIFADATAAGISSLELAVRAIDDESLVISPGVSFGLAWDQYVRVTFLQPEPVLAEGMERLKRVVVRSQREAGA